MEKKTVWLIWSLVMAIQVAKSYMSRDTTFVILFAFILTAFLAVFICQFTFLSSKRWFKGFSTGFLCVALAIYCIKNVIELLNFGV
jgi:hypothetical protein